MARTCIARVGLGLLLAAALGAAGGCSALDALGLARPSARLAGVGLDDINLQDATLRFDVEVTNPYSVPLPLANVDYGLASRGKSFLSGEAPLQGTVPAMGKRTVALPARIVFGDLLAALEGVKLGSVVPYKADLGLSVDAPAAGTLRLPMSKEGSLPVPAPPKVAVEQITWDKLTLDSADGIVKLRVVNTNEWAAELAKMAYGLSLGGTEVARSSIARPVSFAAGGGEGVVEIPISLSPRKLGMAAFQVLTGGGAEYKLNGSMDLSTPFGPMSLPISRTGQTELKR